MAEKGKMIRVRATRTGYFDLKRRKEGAEFVVSEKAFSKSWMEPVETAKPAGTDKASDGAQASGPGSGRPPTGNQDVI